MICGTGSFCSIRLKTFDITCNLCLYSSALLSASSLLHQIRQSSVFQKQLPDSLCSVAGLSKRDWKPYDDCLSWRPLQHTDMSLFQRFVPSPQKFQSLSNLTDTVFMCWVHAQLQNFHQNSFTEIACAVLFSPKATMVQQMCVASLWAKESVRKYMSLSYQNEVGQEENDGVAGLHWRPCRF